MCVAIIDAIHDTIIEKHIIVIPTDVPDKFAAIMSGWATPEEVAGELIRW